MNRSIFAALGAFAACVGSTHGQIGFRILEPQSGFDRSGATGMTSDGRTVVGTSWNEDSGSATMWEGATASQPMVTEPVFFQSSCWAVDDYASSVYLQLYRRLANGGYEILRYAGPPQGPYISNFPQSVGSNFSFLSLSGNGEIVTGERGPKQGATQAEPEGPYAWNRVTGELTMLPVVAPVLGINSEDGYCSGSSANIDSSGRVIVGALRSWAYDVAAKWDRYNVSALPVYQGAPADGSFADAISRNGRYIAGDWWNWLVIWKDDDEPELLNPAPLTAFSPDFIADHGRLALGGGAVWTREYGFQTLLQFLTDHGAPLPAGWTVDAVNALSADGSTFAGRIRIPTTQIYRAFVAYTDYKPCYADFNSDGGVDGSDIEAFFRTWEAGDGDINLDGGVDGADIETFFIQWEAGGCVS
ncbi:MAG: hypothetical protein NTV94_17935 [Planctomycetota bacterium]|nr:hypothetical protein [Planctomycetota bacterium]